MRDYNPFPCSKAGGNLKVLIIVSVGSSKELVRCLMLDMVLTRRPNTGYQTVSSNSLLITLK